MSVSVSEDAEAITASLKSDVTAERALVEIELAEKEAALLAADGNFDDANKLYEGARDQLAGVTAVLKGKISGSQYNNLVAKEEALALQSERLSAPSAVASSSLKSANQSLFYASKGQRKLTVMQVGDKGFEIENLQQALKTEGYAIDAVDGVFDADLEATLRAFQADNGLSVDGIAGPATLAKLGLY